MPTDLNAAIAQALQAAAHVLAAGDARRAADACLSILRLDARHAEALILLGRARLQLQDAAGAVEALAAGLALHQHDADGWVQLGIASRQLGDETGAAAAFNFALRLRPDMALAMNGLGVLAQDRDDMNTGIEWFERAVEVDPYLHAARKNLAFALGLVGDLDGADSQFQTLLKSAPQFGEARLDYAMFRLSCGDFTEGWSLYESRWTSGVYPERDWGEGKPLWRGEALAGRHLLLWGEQGIGDQILYGTMLREAIALAGPGRVTVAVTDRLVPLFSRALSDLDVAVTIREGAAAAADLHCPFGSLGGLLRKSPADFMGHDGAYLRADTAQRDVLRRRYEALGAAGNRVLGLSWRSANPKLASSKSLDLAMLAPLFALPGITWVSVQYGDASGEIAASGLPLHVDGNIDSLKDLDGYAAQLSALDGIVSVSNSAVHMAGALGVPCELLLARGRGRLWYWPRPEEAGSDRSRWYASLRLWHQTKQGKWQNSAEKIAEVLRIS